jgi:DNA-binding NarL/FixJ family response regulator
MQFTANDRSICVMIVDGHAVVRNGIQLSRLAFDDLELVAEAENCEEALAMICMGKDLDECTG